MKNRLPTRLVCFFLILTLLPVSCLRCVRPAAAEEMPVPLSLVNQSILSTVVVTEELSIEGSCTCSDSAVIRVSDGASLLVREGAILYGDIYLSGENAILDITGTVQGNVYVTASSANVFVSGTVTGKMVLDPSAGPDAAQVQVNTTTTSRIHDLSVRTGGQLWIEGHVDSLTIEAENQAMVILHNPSYFEETFPDRERFWTHGHADKAYVYGAGLQLMWSSIDTLYSFGPNNTFDGSVLAHFDCHLGKVFMYGGWVQISEGSTADEVYVLGNDTDLYIGQGFDAGLPSSEHISSVRKVTSIGKKAGIRIEGYVDELAMHEGRLELSGSVKSARLEKVDVNQTNPFGLNEGKRSLRHYLPDYAFHELVARDCSMSFSADQIQVDLAILENCHVQTGGTWDTLAVSGSGIRAMETEETNLPFRVHNLISWGDSSQVSLGYGSQVDTAYGQNASFSYGEPAERVRSAAKNGRSIGRNSRTRPLEMPEGEVLWSRKTNTDYFTVDVPENALLTLGIESPEAPQFLLLDLPEQETIVIRGDLAEPVSTLVTVPGQAQIRLVGAPGDVTTLCEVRPSAAIELQATVRKADESGKGEQEAVTPDSLVLSAVNLTTGQPLPAPSVAQDTLCWLPSDVRPGDEVSLEITDRDGLCAPATVRVRTDGDNRGVVQASLVQRGGFSAMIPDDTRLHAYLYDAQGRYLTEVMLKNGVYARQGMEDGEYQLLLIRGSIGQWQVADLSQLDMFGLAEGQDYLRLPLDIRTGVMLSMAPQVPPQPEAHSEYFSGDTRLSCRSGVATQKALVLVQLDYQAVRELQDMKARLVLTGDSGSVVPESLTVDGTVLESSRDGQDVMIPLPGTSGKLQFYVRTESVGELALSCILSGTDQGETVYTYAGTVNLSVADLSLTAPSMISGRILHLTGNGLPGSTVEVLKDGQVAVQTLCPASGQWNTQVSLDTYGAYDIQARLVLPDGQTLTSDTRTVWRAVGAPSLASITVYYMEHGVQRSVELSGFLLDSGKLRFSYEPGTEFIFAIHAENADLIDTMTVQCEGNGASTPLACTYQATTGEWIARGRISDDDYFVPRSIQVSYTVNDDPREPSETILPTLGLRDLTPSVDLDIGSLRLVRSYPVHAGLHTVQGMFGPGWMTNLDIHAALLEEDGKEAILIITAGAFRFFEKSESGRFQEMGGSASMTLSQAGMTLEEASGGRLVFDAAGRLMQHTNADGTGWKYTYDTAGQLITVTDHQNQTMELTWCEGHVVEARCGEEHILYHYMQGYLAAVQRDDDTEIYAYSGDLEIPGRHSLATVMGSGGMVQLEYDEFGRITRYRTADEDETLEYPDEYTVRMTSLTGNVEEFHYSDENMLLLSHTTASGTTNYTYDAMYRLAQTEKNGFVTSYTYDSENRLIASESRLSRYELSYDKNGNLASSRLGGEGAISYTWNSDGKCTGITYQDGTREQFEYTKEGRLQKFTSRDGKQTQYRYLPDGTLQEIIRPDGHTSYEWNDDRQGVNIEENGTYTYVAYDQEGRVSSVSYPDHYAVSVEYAEEDRLGKVGFGKEPLPEEWEEYQAKVDAAEASLQTLTDVWEALCADETSTEEEQAEAFSQVQAAEAELRQIQEHPPETDWLYQLVYEYDGNGLLTGVAEEELGSIAEIRRIDKDDFMLRQIRYANGATASRLYEAGMTVLTGVTSPDGQVLGQQMPMYDAAGRIAATFSDRDTAAYLYDEEGRLAYEAHGKSSVLVDYDMSGNRVALQEEEVNIPVTVNELGQVTAKGDIRYSYDQAGRRISSTGPDGTEEYLWNSRDQLTGIRGKRNLDFTYDVFGMLSGITEGNRTTRLYTLPAGYNFTLAEIDSEENLFCHVWTEYGLLATLNGQDTSYYGFNVHGDICTVLDESGEVIQRNVFDASGNPIRDSADVDGYSYRGGSGIRSLGGIYNMRARWYDPGTMTFLSPDSAKTTYDLNLYRYANQDPVNYVDLTGFAYIQDPITGITYDIEIHKYKHQNPFEMTPEEYEKSVKEIEQMLKDLEDWKNWEKWKEWQEQQEENGKDEGKDYSKEIDPDEIPTVIIDPIPSPGTLPPLVFVPPEDTERPNVLPQPLPEPKDPGIEIFPLPGPRKPEIEIFPAPQPQFPNYIPDYVQPIPGGGGRMDVRQPFRLIDQDWWINLNEYSYEHPVLFRFEVGTGVVLVGLVFVYGGPLLTDIGQLIGFLLASLPKFAYAAVKYVLPAFLIFRPIFADASIDPSGYVYEAVRDNRLEGVKTTVFYRDDQGNAVFWDAEEYDQANPQISDEEGLYGWYVPEGLWKVTYQKEGYKDTESEWLPVPPPQTEVNIGMESTETPAIEYTALYDDGIEIVFTRYMQTDTVNLSSLDLQGAEPVQVIPLDEAQDDLGKSVARKYMLIYRGNPTRCVLSVNENAMSYTGIPCGVGSRSLDLVSRTTGAELNVDRLTVGENREIQAGLLCNGNASGHTLKTTSVTPSLLQIVQEKGQEGTGNVLLTVQALRPGTAYIHVTDETTGFETDLRITIDF